MRPQRSYFICTLPRSGSWLLAESLEKTKIAGRPREYFDPVIFEKKSSEEKRGALANIIQKGMTENGVFSVKFHWYQFEFAPRLLTSNGDANLPIPILMARRFPNLSYIWLSRRDKVRQAISYYRASKTGQWWEIPGVNADTEPQIPEFDFDRINYLERLLLSHESRWQKYFEENDLDPLFLVYEEFVDNHALVVTEVLKHVGISQPDHLDIRPRLKRQSDALTEEWVERYQAMKKGRVAS